MANKDEKLTEAQALAQAKAEGYEFVDEFTVEGIEDTFTTHKKAVAAAKKAGVEPVIQQTRRRI